MLALPALPLPLPLPTALPLATSVGPNGERVGSSALAIANAATTTPITTTTRAVTALLR
jgi:hypothetical protein